MGVHVFDEVLGHPLQLFHLPHTERDSSTWDRNRAGGRRLCTERGRAVKTAFILEEQRECEVELLGTAEAGGVFSGGLEEWADATALG